MDDLLAQLEPAHMLNDLLRTWVDVAFGAQERPLDRLEMLWFQIAQVLCNRDPRRTIVFSREMHALRQTPQAGYPPTAALERRIGQLMEAGLRGYFLIVAIRQGMDQRVPIEVPEGAQAWQRLADERLPVRLAFSVRVDEMVIGQSNYGPVEPL